MTTPTTGILHHHVVAIPYPGRGHINPMLNLCRTLASRTNQTLYTIVLTEEWLGFIGSQIKPDNLKFVSIPNIVPSELSRAADMVTFLAAVKTKMEEPFEQLLNRLQLPVQLIISDTLLPWSVPFGNRKNIPVASFWTTCASVFSILYHSQLLVQHNHFPELSERGDELVDYIPGLSTLRAADLPISFTKERSNIHFIVNAISLVPKAQYLLFASVYELELDVVDALKPKLAMPILTVGPNIPLFQLQASITSYASYMKWLDSQSPGSVLYISNGSYLSVTTCRMNEIAVGLKETGVPFLWVARGEASRLKTICGGAGMVVPWCDQLSVLCHPAIGGFWTHCGWNSTMESCYAGVPFIASPIDFDQYTNRKLMVEDWKNGCNAKEDMKREEIVELVKRFMDPQSIGRKDMMIRVRELRRKLRQATENGGSSYDNLDAFITDFISQGNN